MRNFLFGVTVGIMVAAAVPALAAQLVGSNGYLMGWDIRMNSETICSDPYIWTSIKEIECD